MRPRFGADPPAERVNAVVHAVSAALLREQHRVALRVLGVLTGRLEVAGISHAGDVALVRGLFGDHDEP